MCIKTMPDLNPNQYLYLISFILCQIVHHMNLRGSLNQLQLKKEREGGRKGGIEIGGEEEGLKERMKEGRRDGEGGMGERNGDEMEEVLLPSPDVTGEHPEHALVGLAQQLQRPLFTRPYTPL